MPWLKKYYPYVLGAALLVATGILRAISYPIESADYTASLSHWMDALSAPGLTAFAQTFSNYPPFYLYLLKLLKFIPIIELYAIKTLSLLFDVVLAVAVTLIVRRFSGREYSKGILFLIFAIALSLPTVFINSSLWAQCDSIYAAFVLFSLYFILKDDPFWASIMLGLALSFKLQAIFFLPAILGYLLLKKRSYVYLLLLPITFIITLTPALIGGGSFNDLFLTYVRQMGEFKDLTLSAPSIYSIIGESRLGDTAKNAISIVGYIISLIASLVIIVYSSTIHRMPANRDEKNRRIVLISLISVLLIPFLLPHMHERYFYLADVISLLYAAFNPKRWFVPVIVVVASLFSYMPFLSGQVQLFARLSTSISIFGLALLVLLIYLSTLWKWPKASITM